MKTKEKIIDCTLEMFNREGVEKVTTRHIAAELGMSQGNLHYHYPNKNELILALVNQFLAEVESARRYNPEELFQKESVLASMTDNYQIMYAYRFLFIDNEVVWRRLPELKKLIVGLFEAKRIEIQRLIMHYRESGVFRSDISDDQMEYLAEQFIFTITSWLTASAYTAAKNIEIDHYAKFTFRMWLPYLTDQSMKEWEDIL